MLDEKAISAIEAIFSHLSNRTATLFLGAGVNDGTKNDRGELFPLGTELSSLICRDLLMDGNLKLPLDEAAEIAKFKLGEKALNDYLFQLFTSFKPSTAHLCIIQLPWDVIYTTNYDLLIEDAAKSPAIKSAGKIQKIFSNTTNLSQFSEEDILYYKLHGSIDFANDKEGKLVITKNDYRHYEQLRRSLFKRLESELISRTFLFIGYSLSDTNFRLILDDCRDELGAKAFPLSYAIRKDFNTIEETYWREKYNIQLIKADATEFVDQLKNKWIDSDLTVISFEEKCSKAYKEIDAYTRFPKLGESFYQLKPAYCSGSSNPNLFFKGREPSWADIRDKIPPPLQNFWTLLDNLFEELVTPNSPIGLYLVTGHAGTGKTTLIRSIAYEVATEFKTPVLFHIPTTPLDARLLGPLVDTKNPHRILIFIHHAADYIRELETFVQDIKLQKIPVSIILEERKNQWQHAAQSSCKIAPAIIESSSLSEKEIDMILDSLAKYNCLEKLTGTPIEYQRSHFLALAHKELLVALRELVTENNFDEIIKDEYASIPSEIAKKAYLYVSALGQADLPLRYESLIKILDIRFDQLGNEICRPTDGILISGEISGNSRHNIGFNLSTRHPIIASIIFATAAPDDSAKYRVLNEIISNLDQGYSQDCHLLEEILKRKGIVNTLASHENRRAIFDRLESVMPNNPFVFQHRSILEKEMENAEKAEFYARKAVAMKEDNLALQNTLGLALEFAARTMTNDIKKKAYITEANKIFEASIRKVPHDPYGYIGKLHIMKLEIYDEVDLNKKAILQAKTLSFLNEAKEATHEAPMILGAIAEQKNQIGDPENAIVILRKALEKQPTDSRLRDLLIKLIADKGNIQEALKEAMLGVKYDTTSWRMQRHMARLTATLDGSKEAVDGHYQAALRHNKSDLSLIIEYGSYLFKNGLISHAKELFNQSRNLSVGSQEKTIIREWWKDKNNNKILFKGDVINIIGPRAFILAIPENFETFFWRTNNETSRIKVKDHVVFYVGFNAYGPIAKIKI